MGLRIASRLQNMRALYNRIHQAYEILPHVLMAERVERLKQSPKYSDVRSLRNFGYKIFSQGDDDGIIREIFNRIGMTNKQFIEFGVGHGLWIEANKAAYDAICAGLKNTISRGQLKLVNAFLTVDNINQTIADANLNKEIDLLSIDIDGNDLYMLQTIECVKPRLIVIEYNPKFPPPILYCMEYDAKYVWKTTDTYGASLKLLELCLAERGYSLVACSLTGENAFFVRGDLVDDRFEGPFTAEKHYEPPRYELVRLPVTFPPSYATLDSRVTKPGKLAKPPQ